MKIEITDSIPLHVAQLKKNLRHEDKMEVLRLGISVEHALWQSYKKSIVRKTALVNNEVAALWGCSGNLVSKEGRVWLLTSPAVRKVSPLKFARRYQQQVYNMLDIFSVLENYVDASYSNAIRLLEIIGFTVESPQLIGQDMFRHFYIERA